ncbi:sigma-70 family RNA polymerase sigma factor [Pedobacter frigoris]|uniref:Sigma-70 family RNA polymerase sigma factor n=1 Tax=Pedobacter frigoris TaxID=2571272 RepID=A0A4U1CNU7_9SPHI|nr:sigma-70 family RNA polymerase sigma factor [Pedobacter frigoris]TKC07135.1 sigma-70 family RNA polymerase sigma factor [Pedobacter frigoris]
MQLEGLNDAELWAAVKNNDAKAYNMLFDRHWSAVFTTSHKYIKDTEVCYEITHDIFLNIWNKRAQLNILSVKAYLSASARYHVYKRKQGVRSLDIQYIDDYEQVQQRSVNNTAAEQFDYTELEARIDAQLSKLPNRSREIFLLSRKENLSNDEIAVKLSISKRTVENQITNVLKHLRFVLKQLSILLALLNL